MHRERGRTHGRAGARRLLADLENRDDWGAHALRHDLALLLAPRRPGREALRPLVLGAPRQTKTPPHGPHAPPHLP